MAETEKKPDCWKDRRLFARSHVIWDGRLRSGGQEQGCVILDLSATGAMVRLTENAPSPAHVAVCADRFGELHGRVVWQQDNVVGLSFAERPQQIARILANAVPGLRLAS